MTDINQSSDRDTACGSANDFAEPDLDSHVHVWDWTCTMIPQARYHPRYNAPVDDLLRVLDRNAIARAVLVQPSFLGTDNSYLLRALSRHSDRLRGIAVVDPDASDQDLDDMTGAGVIGLRLNLRDFSADTAIGPAYAPFRSAAVARDLWIEVHGTGADWATVLPILIGDGAKVMVDHFGRPDHADCPGLAAILSTDPTRLAIKLSAPYRQSVTDMPAIAERLIAHCGADRCLWGSDWPWTRAEARHSYGDLIARHLETVPAEARRILNAAAPAIIGFHTRPT